MLGVSGFAPRMPLAQVSVRGPPTRHGRHAKRVAWVPRHYNHAHVMSIAATIS
jgi:hypothetical protein